MSIRFSKEEALLLGFTQDAQGNWYQPGAGPGTKAGIGAGSRNSDQVSQHKSNPKRKTKRSTKTEKTNERGDEKSKSSQVRYVVTVISFETKNGSGADTDNVCPKWFIDEMIKSGICPADLTDDNFEQICLTQKAIKRVGTRKEQKTLIRLHRII